MIDGLFKKHIDPLWEKAARPLAATGVTPNAVTMLGLALVVTFSAAFVAHGSTFWFGVSLIGAFAFDSLDGAVARLRNLRSKRGGYLDAMVDRYQELAVMLALGQASGAWVAVLAGFSGAVITSYAKARTALEIRVGNDDWPDLFERQERLIFICALLISHGLLFQPMGAGPQALVAGLWIYAALAHFTALQRMRRAWKLLEKADRDPDGASS